MNAQSFRPTVETLEGRDAPVILITVVTPLPLLGIDGISFTPSADPQHAHEVRVDSRGASVSITLDPCPRC